MRAKRRLGQHFLSDPSILRQIADALDPGPEDTVLEIGPGRGALTTELAARAGAANVIAIERDSDLVPTLAEVVPGVRVVEGDALRLDWHELVEGRPFLVAGNIPYNITSPLLEKALERPRPRRAVFLVQREVGERLAAVPGTKAYGALSVGVQAVARVEQVLRVPAGAFRPPPKVESVVVRLTPLNRPLVSEDETTTFRRLVTGLFAARRKQLARGLRGVTTLPAGDVVRVLTAEGIDPAARPETLEPAQFVGLLRRLVDLGWPRG